MRISFLILIVLTASCTRGIKKEKQAGNDSLLHAFVLRTTATTENAGNELDSILTNSKDSSLFCSRVNYLEKPFGDPNSSYRNENLFGELLQAKIRSSWYDSSAKRVARKRLYLLMQNRVNTTANDFIYTTAAGSKKKMYELDADFTLLYFYNPECEACKEMKTALMASPVISNKIATGKLKLLAIYTDRDEKLWLDHLHEMPGTWIQGRDEEEYLYKNDVYDLRAIPTIYLLDKNKKVILKDAMQVDKIEQQLSR